MVAVPAAGLTLTNAGAKTAGGMENIGAATSSTFTMTDIITCTETVSVPYAGLGAPPYDGLETAAGPMISITNISIPSSWTVPATSKSESLSGIGSAANNTSAGTFTIFPNVKITVTQGASTVSGGVGAQVTTATITGPVTELDDWVVPWSPVDSTPNFDGSDFGLARSSGYGNTAKGGPGIFYITFTLKFFLAAFSDGPWPGSPTELDFKI
ncbi:uncharacterized protein METZ01_LOCUS339213, partial [marine metagenome]